METIYKADWDDKGVLCVYSEDDGWAGFDDLCDGCDGVDEMFSEALIQGVFDNMYDENGCSMKDLVEMELKGV
jgi:hypothetical protein